MAEVQVGLKEQLMEQLIPLVEKTGQGLMGAIEILEKECPQLVREILLYHGAVRFGWWLAATLLVVVLLLCMKKRVGWEWAQAHEQGTSDFSWFIVGFTYVVGMLSGVIVHFLTYGWIKVWLAPRLFLLEYVQKMF